MTTHPCAARQQKCGSGDNEVAPDRDLSRGQRGGVSLSASALGGLCGAQRPAPCRRRCQPGRPLYRPQWRGRGPRGCLGGSEPLPPANPPPRPCVAASVVCWRCLPTGAECCLRWWRRMNETNLGTTSHGTCDAGFKFSICCLFWCIVTKSPIGGS